MKLKYFIIPLMCQLAFGLNFSESVLVSGGVSSHNLYPDLAVSDSGDIYIVWVNTLSGGDVHFSMSTNQGQTFSQVSTVNSVLNHATTIGFSGPQVEVWGDTIHVLWTDQRDGYAHTSAYYARSIDQGVTWEETQIGHPNGVNFYPELLVDSQGILHASFHYFQSGSFAYRHIAHTFSIDGGNSWSELLIVSDYEPGEPCDCCPIDLHELPNGKIINGFRNNVDNIRDMFSMEWNPENSSWINLSPMSFDEFYISYCPTNGPSLVSQDSLLAMAYMTELNGEARIFLTVSENMGDTFPITLSMNMTSGTNIFQSHPSSAITSDGDIHILWEDSRDGGNIRYGRRGVGQSFISDISTVNDSMTTSAEIAPRLATDTNNNLYAVWVDKRLGRHIRFSSTLTPVLSTETNDLPETFTLYAPYPNPFNPVTTIQFFSGDAKMSHHQLKIFDITGQLIETLVDGTIEPGHHEIQWNASIHSSGIYFISLTKNGLSKTVKSIFVK